MKTVLTQQTRENEQATLHQAPQNRGTFSEPRPLSILTTSVHLGPFLKNLINLFQKAPLARAETTKKQDFQLRQWRMELKLCRRLQRETTASLISRARWITLLESLNAA